MSVWKRLTHLVPSIRRAADRDMRDELESLKEIAGPRELGNLTLAAEDARGQFVWLGLERVGQDVRYGLRSMRRDKLFAGLAVVSLALGIGANTAIYSFMDSVLLRPLPVADPEALVVMKWQAQRYTLASSGMSWSTGGSSTDGGNTLSSIFPYPALKVFQDRTDVFSSAFCYFVNDQLSVTVRDNTDSVLGQFVSGDYFTGMGVTPAAGRLIQVLDDAATPSPVAVVSERLSASHFGGAQAAVGQTIRVNDKPYLVIGVAPANFFGAEPGAIPDLYLPMHASPIGDVYSDDHFYWIEVMARLKTGVSLAQAQARVGPAFHRFVAASATTDAQRQDLPQLRIQDGATGLDSLRRRYAQPIYLLMAMVLVMLFVACSNIANLLLARSAARRREIAIRLGLGASRWRVVRQLLTESLLLSFVGGAFGVALAWWGIHLLTVLLSNGRENFTLHAALNWHVLAVTVTLSVLTGIQFGLAPALQATRVDLAPALKEARVREALGPSRRVGIGSLLVVTQMAFSLLLLVSAGLFDRTLSSLHAIPLGFNREHVLLFTIRPYAVGYQGPSLNLLFEGLRGRLDALPGVRDVSLSAQPLPMGGGTMAPVSIGGSPAAAAPTMAVLASVGPDFFKTMQIPIVNGRDFADRDGASAPHIAVVNRRLAAVWGVANPVGQVMTLGKNQFEIVGMAEDALSFNLKDAPRPGVYFPYLQSARPSRAMTYEIRTAGDPVDLASSVRETVRQTDARLAIHDLKTQADHIDQAISTEITLAPCARYSRRSRS